MTLSRIIVTPIARLVVSSNADGITAIFPDTCESPSRHSDGDSYDFDAMTRIKSHLDKAEKWLCCYFMGDLESVELPCLCLEGTEFQLEVWNIVRNIPYGKTITYGDVARCLGKSGAVCRAIGQAIKHNRIMIMVPCHRVIGAGGHLAGFAYGVGMKKRLLDFENRSVSVGYR